MEKQFCDYEISFALKDLGFDERCLAYHSKERDLYEDDNGGRTSLKILTYKYSGELSNLRFVTNSLFIYFYDNKLTSGELYCLSYSATAPLWQQAVDWFRTKHKLHITINNCGSEYPTVDEDYEAYYYSINEDYNGFVVDTYEEARRNAILEAIDLIKTKTL